MNPSSPMPSHDPELTRHALGESESSSASQPSMAARYWTDPAAREHIDLTRELSQELIFFFSTETPPSLTTDQRTDIVDHAIAAKPTEELEQRLIDHLVGEVTTTDPAQWEEKIAQSRAIRYYLEKVRREISAIRETQSEEAPLTLTPPQRAHIFTEGARRRAMAKIETTPVIVSKRPPAQRPSPIYLRAAWIAAAAAVLVIGYVQWREAATLSSTATERTSTADRHIVTRSAQPPPTEKKADELHVPSQPTATPDISGLPSDVTLPVFSQTDPQLSAPIPPMVQPTPGALTDLHMLPSARSPLVAASATQFSPAHLSPVLELGSAIPSNSFSLLRSWFNHANTYPPREKWRGEELIAYAASLAPETVPASASDKVHGQLEVAVCPWNDQHVLVRATLSTPPVALKKMPPRRLTLLVRWSSTHPDNERARLILWGGLRALEDAWRPEDQLSLILWGEKNGALMHQGMIKTPSQALAALNHPDLPVELSSDEALSLAVQTAISQRTEGSTNHFIIATDGPLDFTHPADTLAALRSAYERCAVYAIQPQVYQCGWPTSSIASDSPLRTTVLDSVLEAQAHFTQQLNQPANAVINGLRANLEFSPTEISSVRLLGFHPTATSPAPVLGASWTAGQKTTLFYEAIPATHASTLLASPLRQDDPAEGISPTPRQITDPLHLTLRWKYQTTEPQRATTTLEHTTWQASAIYWPEASEAFRLSAAAAGLCLMMQPTTTDFPAETLSHLVQSTFTHDPDGRRAEFHHVIEKASLLRQRTSGQ